MLKNLIECILYLLAAYGLIVLISSAARLIQCRVRGCRPDVRAAILVKNAEENIEYIIRSAVTNEFASSVFSDKRLIVVDMGSTDNTLELLEELQKEYCSIEVLKCNEREQIFCDFSVFPPSGK